MGTDAGHGHWDELAFAHAMGDLSPDDADGFRVHLAACRTCRARVTELGRLDAALTATARSSDVGSTTTTVRRRPAVDSPAGAQVVGDRLGRWLLAALALVGLLAIGLAAVHWRSVARLQEAELEVRAEVTDLLANGELVPVEVESGLQATLSHRDGWLGLDVRGLEHEPGTLLFVWARNTEGESQRLAVIAPEQLSERGLALVIQITPDVAEVLITRESGMPAGPWGDLLLRAQLQSPLTGGAASTEVDAPLQTEAANS